MPDPVVVALPKGRILEQLIPRFAQAGVDVAELTIDDRRLVREANGVRFLLLKPDDVPTYVEYGVADLGVVGRDVLAERDYDLYAPLDLGIGRCRLVLAAPKGIALQPTRLARPLRVATKFPQCARRHFAQKGLQVETIFVQGSVELAPLTGLADVIVDLVDTGETLKQNGLEVCEVLFDVTSLLVANRVGLKLKRTQLAPLLAALRGSAPTKG